ncbi:MAG: hypothetical protein Q8O74_01310, partial [bacterium]|nr:hypothetical protein [bacterium]
SAETERPVYTFPDGGKLRLDTIGNIVSNKLCTLVSRTEPKDFIDFYAIFKTFTHLRFDRVYIEAQAKEGIFDDYPTSAYQIEKNFQYILRNRRLWPKMVAETLQTDFEAFYSSVIKSIYQMAKDGIQQ